MHGNYERPNSRSNISGIDQKSLHRANGARIDGILNKRIGDSDKSKRLNKVCGVLAKRAIGDMPATNKLTSQKYPCV